MDAGDTSKLIQLNSLAQGLLEVTPAKGTEGNISFCLNQFAHPGWNTGKQKAVTLQIKSSQSSSPDEASVTLTNRGSTSTGECSSKLPIINGKLTLIPEKFPGFPPFHSWRSIVRVKVQLDIANTPFTVGPLVRID